MRTRETLIIEKGKENRSLVDMMKEFVTLTTDRRDLGSVENSRGGLSVLGGFGTIKNFRVAFHGVVTSHKMGDCRNSFFSFF